MTDDCAVTAVDSRFTYIHTLLEKLRAHDDTLNSCTKLYFQCEKNAAACEFIVGADGIEILCPLLWTFVDSSAITFNVCKTLVTILQHVDMTTDANKQRFKGARGWHALAHVFGFHNDKVAIMLLACDIVKLAFSDVNDEVLFCQEDGIANLLTVLSEHIDNERMVFATVSALQCACMDLFSFDQFGESNGVGCLTEVIMLHVTSACVVQATCELMSAVCELDINRLAFADSDARSALRLALKRHAASPLILDAICKAMFRPLCTDDAIGMRCYDRFGSAALSAIAMSIPEG